MSQLSQTCLKLDVALKLELGSRQADGMVVHGWFLWKIKLERRKYNSEFSEFYSVSYIERLKHKTATRKEPSNDMFVTFVIFCSI